jgi:basic membrane protein A
LASTQKIRRTQVNKVSRKAIAGVAMAAASLLVLSGCAAKPGAGFIECGVSDEGSWADKSFNESVMDGMEKAAEEFGVTLNSAESTSSEDFAPNLDAMVAAKCDVIFAVGFNLVDAVNAAAEANPEVNFVTIDGWSNGATNLKPVGYNMAESSYLAGYAAAYYSKTKVVSVYGGVQISAVTAFMDGFYYGAKAYEKETGTPVTVLGWDAVKQQGDFIGGFAPNAPEGKTIAAGHLAANADVLVPVGGDQFGALSEAIAESGVDAKMIGVDKNISVTSPEYAPITLTSIEKRMGSAVYDIVKALAVDKEAFAGGMENAYTGTLANAGTDISDTEFLDEALKTKLAELKAGIIDGSINPLG